MIACMAPSKSKRECLLFLDDAIDEIDNVQIEVNDAATKRMIDEPCARVWMPIIEYPICRTGKPL